MATTELALRDERLPALPAELTIDELVAQTRKIHEAMTKVMVDGTHYGVIPGTPKPTLLQPGAQKLCLLFRLDPQFVNQEERDGLHLTIKSTCTLYHIPTGARCGSGQGSCSTREVKYAYRESKRRCPKCGKEAIIRGKEEYGGGWLCFRKRDGCGVTFKVGDPSIEGQAVGRVPNEDVADAYNTVLKMANKRALVAAVLNVTGASDIFTQDLEDMPAADDSPKPATVRVVETARHEPEGPLNLGGGGEGNGPAPREGAPDDDSERDIILGRINGTSAKLGLKASKRIELWERYCPDTPSMDFSKAPLEHLNDLYKELQRMAQAAPGAKA